MTCPRVRFALLAVLAPALAAGCCSTFERDWNALACCPAPADSLAGLWEGSWESDHNGHSGALRAIITPCGDNRYFARYDARFCWFIPYGYDTQHNAVADGLKTHFVGEADLGKLAGGVYRCAGWADGERYVASYRADKDHGTFRMCRVGCGRVVAASGSVPGSAPQAEADPTRPPIPDAHQPQPPHHAPTNATKAPAHAPIPYDDEKQPDKGGVVPPPAPK